MLNAAPGDHIPRIPGPVQDGWLLVHVQPATRDQICEPRRSSLALAAAFGSASNYLLSSLYYPQSYRFLHMASSKQPIADLTQTRIPAPLSVTHPSQTCHPRCSIMCILTAGASVLDCHLARCHLTCSVSAGCGRDPKGQQRRSSAGFRETQSTRLLH